MQRPARDAADADAFDEHALALTEERALAAMHEDRDRDAAPDLLQLPAAFRARAPPPALVDERVALAAAWLATCALDPTRPVQSVVQEFGDAQRAAARGRAEPRGAAMHAEFARWADVGVRVRGGESDCAPRTAGQPVLEFGRRAPDGRLEFLQKLPAGA